MNLQSKPLSRARQRGLSLVELMVGIAVGLVIVAGASVLMTTQLFENRRLVAETQMQQDLRAATDVMARDVRRAGSAGEGLVLGTLWFPGATETTPNVLAEDLVMGTSGIDFTYKPVTEVTAPPMAFALQGNAIKTKIKMGMQELTDPNIMKVTSMATDMKRVISVALPCPNVCLAPVAGDDTACWPRYEVRKLRIDVQAEAKADNKVKRNISSTVRLRNDRVQFSDAPANRICPL